MRKNSRPKEGMTCKRSKDQSWKQGKQERLKLPGGGVLSA